MSNRDAQVASIAKSAKSNKQLGLRRLFSLLALIAAGETIFFLPFVLARVFRPTLLEVFGLTNLELGTAFSLTYPAGRLPTHSVHAS